MLESMFRSISQSGSSLAFMMILAGGSIMESDEPVVDEVVEEPPPSATASPSPWDPAESGSPVDIILRAMMLKLY